MKMKYSIFTHIIKYNTLYQLLINIAIWSIFMLFMLDKNIVLAEEISEIHKRLRNRVVEETYRDYLGVNIIIEGGPYKRDTVEEMALTESFYTKRYILIDNIINDYFLKNNSGRYYAYYDNVTKPALYSYPVDPEDYISEKSPVMRLAYMIKKENLYYLTLYEKFALNPIIKANLPNMSPVTIDIFNNILKFGFCNPIIIDFNSEIQFQKIIEEVVIIENLIGSRPFIREVYFNINEQFVISNLLKENPIPRDRLAEYFKSEQYQNLISNIRNNIFNENIPF